MTKSKETKHGNDRGTGASLHGRANSGADQGGSVGAEGGAGAFASGGEPRSIFAGPIAQAGTSVTATALNSKASRHQTIANAIALRRFQEIQARNEQISLMQLVLQKSVPSDYGRPVACAPGPLMPLYSAMTQQEIARIYAALQQQPYSPTQMQQMMAQMQAQFEPPRDPWADIKHEGIQHVGEIIAYRCWDVDRRPQMLLRSTSADQVWQPGEVMEGDVSNPEHGVHAYKHMGTVFEEFGNRGRFGLRVYGRVKLWGEVYQHRLGYRAEFAKPYALDGILPSERLKELEFLRDRYFPKDPQKSDDAPAGEG